MLTLILFVIPITTSWKYFRAVLFWPFCTVLIHFRPFIWVALCINKTHIFLQHDLYKSESFTVLNKKEVTKGMCDKMRINSSLGWDETILARINTNVIFCDDKSSKGFKISYFIEQMNTDDMKAVKYVYKLQSRAHFMLMYEKERFLLLFIYFFSASPCTE